MWYLPYHSYLCRDGCVKCTHLRHSSCLSTLSASKNVIFCTCMWSFIYPSRFLKEMYFKSSCLYAFFKLLEFALRDYTLAVDASLLTHQQMASNSWYSLPPPLPLRNKAHEVSHSYGQNKVQKDRPQRISWLLVAISNTTCIAIWR